MRIILLAFLLISELLKRLSGVNVNGKFKVNLLTVIRGKGVLSVGSNVTFGYVNGPGWPFSPIDLLLRNRESHVEIGNNVSFNNGVRIVTSKSIRIGDNCRIGQNVCFMDSNGHRVNSLERNISDEPLEIIIGENVWIGANCLILKGSVIGDNSIVSANSVVSGVLEANSIYRGNFAVKIKDIE